MLPTRFCRKVPLLTAVLLCHLLSIGETLTPLLTRPSQDTKKNLLILGFGNVGKEVASCCSSSKQFQQIYGTIRAKMKHEKTEKDLAGPSSDVIRVPLLQSADLSLILPTCNHVLVTIPPPKDPNEMAHLDDVFSEIVNSIPEQSWLGIISTTGVYGDHNGSWVDEDSKLLCRENSTASAFQDFESKWQRHVLQCNRGHSLFIFRCAGIYGPGRSAIHTVFKKGLAVSDQKQEKQNASLTSTTNNNAIRITNRIHVRDIAITIQQAMKWKIAEDESSGCCRVYNLADDLPESREIVMQYAANLLEFIGVPIPRSSQSSNETKSSSARDRRRNSEQKLVKNDRMKWELLSGVGNLMYPTYREGLRAILIASGTPWSKDEETST